LIKSRGIAISLVNAAFREDKTETI